MANGSPIPTPRVEPPPGPQSLPNVLPGTIFIEEVLDVPEICGMRKQQQKQQNAKQTPRETPLLSAAEMKALLPAVAPEARRFVQDVALQQRSCAQQQRQLRELASFSVKSEQARAAAVAEKARLQRLTAQQAQALTVSAHRIHTMREEVAKRDQLLQQEKDRSAELERGLRAALRGQQQHRIAAAATAEWKRLQGAARHAPLNTDAQYDASHDIVQEEHGRDTALDFEPGREALVAEVSLS